MNKSKKNCLKKKFKVLQKIRKVKGTKDLLGDEILSHNFIIRKFEELCKFYNYKQITTPILENSDVFTKSLGLSSDIVSKEMYNFVDQGNDNLVLRPEGTAAIARAIITNSLEQDLNKFFYYGPMFRREKPQSGRLRQFHQVGLEYIGSDSYLTDLEVIITAENFLEKLNIRDKLILQINSLGNLKSRINYNESLKKFLDKNISSLSEISKERLKKNPLRVLDSKEQKDQDVVQNSPSIIDYLDDESKKNFESLINGLEKLNISYKINRFLVRGLDYYNHTAFEYITNEKKSQNTVLAGGRYNGLVSSLGGKDLSGIGWAAGIERIGMQIKNYDFKEKKKICFFSTNTDLDLEILKLINSMKFTNTFIMHFINTGNLKKKFAKANKIGAHGCIVFGEDEWKLKKVIWKDFSSGKQELVNLDNIYEFLNKDFCKKDSVNKR